MTLAETTPSRIPWSRPGTWREANFSLQHLIGRCRGRFAPAAETARALEARLSSLFPVLETLCQATCPHCPQPCCLSARVWVDFKDLLFLHLTGQVLPLGQLMGEGRRGCAGIGLRGCTLPRLSRPWVCTWYLCPAQAARLRRLPVDARARFHDTVASVKALRNRMERQFVDEPIAQSR